VKIIGVIQARMGSQRLPGKVMLPILGKPIIWHIYNRLKKCKLLDMIVISTGDSVDNVSICEFASENNIPIYVGSEEDLVDRLYKTAINFQASAIVRITADCPLVDPKIVDKLVSEYLANKDQYDIITNCKIRTFPHGLDAEVYSVNTLEKLLDKMNVIELRDWFALYAYNHPELFRILNISNSLDLSKLRWTLDYQEDYEFIKQIYQNLYKDDVIFYMDDVLNLIKQKPDIIKINSKYADHHNVGAPKNL
jgi:spore coat polysaccharide biosynthesis protein SpsF